MLLRMAATTRRYRVAQNFFDNWLWKFDSAVSAASGAAMLLVFAVRRARVRRLVAYALTANRSSSSLTSFLISLSAL
jgi:hypothetical protein